ncbi:malonic semialdehyde reductase [Rhodococcus sp. IEGM 1379]|uniref:malonic semialdehyde reductase n=1 Tax=Rhodococcus sp. IEGM 1379 TaxID=3047086 RepID=UPI0024B80641|nr:malonic semialdehyde reductase [Rhodococcus sp. IEGM 1379]MDI9917179.1 malonic semialdehyde reductase [Rhodococcus sp. IEGM 1379]
MSLDAASFTSQQLDAAGRELLFTEARTANTFSNEPVTDAELTAIWELAKWAPTAANTNPLRVLFVRTEEGKARLVEHMSDGNKAKTATAPAVAVLAVDTKFYEHIPVLFPIRPEMKDHFASNEAASTSTSQFNAALQAGYLILAIRAQGLVAGPMAGFDAAGIDGEFFADGRFKTSLVVNIGHPGENPWFDRLPRLANEDALSWA